MTEIIVEPAAGQNGVWVWAVMVDGGVYASGEADDERQADMRAAAHYREWSQKQRGDG